MDETATEAYITLLSMPVLPAAERARLQRIVDEGEVDHEVVRSRGWHA